MSRDLREQLFFHGLAITLLGMGLAGVLFWQAAGSLYLDTQRKNLLAQAELTASLLQGQSLLVYPAETYSQVSNVMPGVHTRVLSEQGAVVIGLPETTGSTPVQMPAAEESALVSPQELRARPEIQAALQGTASTRVREVTGAKRRVLYAAAPVYGQDGQIQGLVYIAEPLPAGGLPAIYLFQITGTLLAAIALALLAGTWLARRITRPVTAFINGADAVSNGNLDQMVPEASGIYELDRLGQAFNRMTTNLKRSDEAQNTFVADVAHELRTPLTVIKGTIETLEDGAVDDLEGRGALLESMQKEADRLIRLVNNLLVLTRADAGVLKLDLQPVDLVDLVKERCERFTLLAASRGVKLTVDADEIPHVLCDEDRLFQVMDNLLDNALRYSPPNDVVRVEIRSVKNEVFCRVMDAGPGIAPEHLPRIFNRFYRADISRSRKGGGSGLGLSIVRALVQAQGGQVIAGNAPEGGAAIGFILPILPEN